MLLRLLLVLLVASFALPAAAAVPACHDAAAPVVMHHGAPVTPVKKMVPAHVCVGCVPLADWTAGRVAARIVPASPPLRSRAVRLDLGGAIAPALPPPREA